MIQRMSQPLKRKDVAAGKLGGKDVAAASPPWGTPAPVFKGQYRAQHSARSSRFRPADCADSPSSWNASTWSACSRSEGGLYKKRGSSSKTGYCHLLPVGETQDNHDAHSGWGSAASRALTCTISQLWACLACAGNALLSSAQGELQPRAWQGAGGSSLKFSCRKQHDIGGWGLGPHNPGHQAPSELWPHRAAVQGERSNWAQ